MYIYGNNSYGGTTGIYTDTGPMSNVYIYSNGFYDCAVGVHFTRDGHGINWPVSNVYVNNNQIRLHKHTFPGKKSHGFYVNDITGATQPILWNFYIHNNVVQLNNSFTGPWQANGLLFQLVRNSEVRDNQFQRCAGTPVEIWSLTKPGVPHSSFSNNTTLDGLLQVIQPLYVVQ